MTTVASKATTTTSTNIKSYNNDVSPFLDGEFKFPIDQSVQFSSPLRRTFAPVRNENENYDDDDLSIFNVSPPSSASSDSIRSPDTNVDGTNLFTAAKFAIHDGDRNDDKKEGYDGKSPAYMITSVAQIQPANSFSTVNNGYTPSSLNPIENIDGSNHGTQRIRRSPTRVGSLYGGNDRFNSKLYHPVSNDQPIPFVDAHSFYQEALNTDGYYELETSLDPSNPRSSQGSIQSTNTSLTSILPSSQNSNLQVNDGLVSLESSFSDSIHGQLPSSQGSAEEAVLPYNSFSPPPPPPPLPHNTIDTSMLWNHQQSSFSRRQEQQVSLTSMPTTPTHPTYTQVKIKVEDDDDDDYDDGEDDEEEADGELESNSDSDYVDEGDGDMVRWSSEEEEGKKEHLSRYRLKGKYNKNPSVLQAPNDPNLSKVTLKGKVPPYPANLPSGHTSEWIDQRNPQIIIYTEELARQESKDHPNFWRVAGKARMRTGNACLHCKKLKTKCSGESPCMKCLELEGRTGTKVLCKYEPPRRRGPGKHNKRKISYIEESEQEATSSRQQKPAKKQKKKTTAKKRATPKKGKKTTRKNKSN